MSLKLLHLSLYSFSGFILVFFLSFIYLCGAGLRLMHSGQALHCCASSLTAWLYIVNKLNQL